MAEYQDQSVALSAKRQETQSDPQETTGDLAVQSVNEDRFKVPEADNTHRPSLPGNRNINKALLEGPDFKRKVAPEIRSILKTLYHSSRPYKDLEDSYSKRHNQLRADRLDGTCTWFIRTQSFGSWLIGGSPRLLWCFGAPGIGKSIIA